MDFFNFGVAPHKTFGIDIRETDYPRLAAWMAALVICRPGWGEVRRVAVVQ